MGSFSNNSIQKRNCCKKCPVLSARDKERRGGQGLCHCGVPLASGLDLARTNSN